jgi:hypothetical protein
VSACSFGVFISPILMFMLCGVQDLIEELIGEEIEDETDANLSPTGPESSESKPLHVRKRRDTVYFLVEMALLFCRYCDV